MQNGLAKSGRKESEGVRMNEQWAILELMGHVRLSGRVSEEERFGCKLGRIDVPVESKCQDCGGLGTVAFMAAQPCPVCKGAAVTVSYTTQFFGGASVQDDRCSRRSRSPRCKDVQSGSGRRMGVPEASVGI